MRVRIGLAMFVLLGLGVALGSQLNQFGIADSQQVTFSTAVKIGDTLVPAGDYKVLHTMQGEDHIMLFEQQGVPKSKAGYAKVKCTLKPLDEAARTNEARFRNESGVEILTLLQFKGDKAQHVF
ncbi:MAG: hypothetical protein JO041_11040 [Acidobacteria bacterium]|nr:hypothetical protein [Acidobacteriota bacterium]